MKGLVVGPLGSAEEVSQSDYTGPQAGFVLGGWILELPDVHPVWDYYYLSLAHLRADEGAPAPDLHYPGATHEIMLSALDSEKKPDKRRPAELRPMRPTNMVVQFGVTTDEQAVAVLQHTAQAVVDGGLPAEPQGFMGAAAQWTEVVRRLAAHVMETGCKEAEAFAPEPEGGGSDGR